MILTQELERDFRSEVGPETRPTPPRESAFSEETDPKERRFALQIGPLALEGRILNGNQVQQADQEQLRRIRASYQAVWAPLVDPEKTASVTAWNKDGIDSKSSTHHAIVEAKINIGDATFASTFALRLSAHPLESNTENGLLPGEIKYWLVPSTDKKDQYLSDKLKQERNGHVLMVLSRLARQVEATTSVEDGSTAQRLRDLMTAAAVAFMQIMFTETYQTKVPEAELWTCMVTKKMITKLLAVENSDGQIVQLALIPIEEHLGIENGSLKLDSKSKEVKELKHYWPGYWLDLNKVVAVIQRLIGKGSLDQADVNRELENALNAALNTEQRRIPENLLYKLLQNPLDAVLNPTYAFALTALFNWLESNGKEDLLTTILNEGGHAPVPTMTTRVKWRQSAEDVLEAAARVVAEVTQEEYAPINFSQLEVSGN